MVKCRKNSIIKIVPRDVYEKELQPLGFVEVGGTAKRVIKTRPKLNDYKNMKFADLKSIAKQKGLKVYRATSKAELINLLERGVGNK